MSKANVFTSEMKCSNFTSKASRFGEDVKEKLRFLSEERLRRVKRRLACPAIAFGNGGRLRSPFFGQKKWRLDLLDYLADRSVFEYRNGCVYRNSLPGLGIEINEEVVRKAAAVGHDWKNPV